MSISNQVHDFIGEQQVGAVFLLCDIHTYDNAKKATSKAVRYYVTQQKSSAGRISKIADGMFYKDEVGLLGQLPPSFDATLRALTYQNDVQVGYVVGHQLYYQLGLSTQVPAIVSVVTSKQAPTNIDVAGIKMQVSAKKQTIKSNDIKWLELSYVLNNISQVQSLVGENIYRALATYFDDLTQSNEQFEKVYDSLVYKRTKALFGALLEYYQESSNKDLDNQLNLIQSDLSHRSEYRWGHLATFLPNHKRWQIGF